MDTLGDRAQRFNVSIYSISLVEEKWLEVGIEEEEQFVIRELFNFYAKWNDVPVFYQFRGPLVLQQKNKNIRKRIILFFYQRQTIM